MRKIFLGLFFIILINYGYANYEVEVSNIYDNDFSQLVNFAPNNGGYIKTLVSNSDGEKASIGYGEDIFYYDELNDPYNYENFQYIYGKFSSKLTIIDDKGNKISDISKKGYDKFSENGKSYALSLSYDSKKWFLYYDGKKSKSYDYINYYYGKYNYIQNQLNNDGNILIYFGQNKKGKGIDFLLKGDNKIIGGEQIIGINGQEYNLYDGLLGLGFSNTDNNKFAFGVKIDGKAVLYKNGIEYGKYDEIGDIEYFDNGNLIFSAKKDGKWFIDKEGNIYNSNSIDKLQIKFTTDGQYGLITNGKKTIIINENSNNYKDINNISYCDNNIKNGYIYCSGFINSGTSNLKKIYYKFNLSKDIFEEGEYKSNENKINIKEKVYFYTYKNGNLVINNNGQEYELKNYELLFQTNHVFFLKNKINKKQVMFVNGNFSNEYDSLDFSDIFNKYIIATINGKKLIINDNLIESEKYDNIFRLGKLEDDSIIFNGEKDGKKYFIINSNIIKDYTNIINIDFEIGGDIIITYEKDGKYYSTILYKKDLIEKYGLRNIKETPKTIQANPELDKILAPFFEKTDEKGDEIAQKTYKTLISKIDILLKKRLSVKNKNTLNYLKEKVQEKIK